MEPSNLTNEEKRRLSNERQNAVRHAWKNEKSNVLNGQGTRNWSIKEQKEIIWRGAATGYEGHHMKSVSLYPEYAGDARNIQFLSEDEHFQGAHQGNYHNITNGYYDPDKKKMFEFKVNELVEVPKKDLELKYCNTREFEKERLKQSLLSEAKRKAQSAQERGIERDTKPNEDHDREEMQAGANCESKTESHSKGIRR